MEIIRQSGRNSSRPAIPGSRMPETAPPRNCLPILKIVPAARKITARHELPRAPRGTAQAHHLFHHCGGGGFLRLLELRREDLRVTCSAPIMEALHRNGMTEKLVYLNPTEPFNLYLKIGLMAGLFVASPSCCTRCGCSSRPGSYRNEKRYVMPFMVLDRRPVPGGRALRLQDGLSGGARFPDRLRQAVPADDHDRRVHRSLSDHHHRTGR